MSFPKIVNQMGSFGEKRKKNFFRFCRPILDIFGFPLLIHLFKRWLKMVSSTFQRMDFDGPFFPTLYQLMLQLLYRKTAQCDVLNIIQ